MSGNLGIYHLCVPSSLTPGCLGVSGRFTSSVSSNSRGIVSCSRVTVVTFALVLGAAVTSLSGSGLKALSILGALCKFIHIH